MTSSALAHNSPAFLSAQSTGLKLRCPRCGEDVGSVSEATPSGAALLMCLGCLFQLHCDDGIWRGLLPERVAHFSRFMRDYASIRAAEGRGSDRAEYYLNLPFRDISGRNAAQWAIRARTFRYMEQNVLPAIVAGRGGKLRILDLGAGNGWLSYRLALQGHSLIAVDLQTGDRDGLGAALHYKARLNPLFLRFQAEMDRLPFANAQFDLVIFNASFHYAENCERVLAEAIRCARPGGTILIADTPWYRKEEIGRRMVKERRANFAARYGTASAEIDSIEFLTPDRLRRMEDCFGIRWQVHAPYYGVRWNLRPLLAKLRGKREPSRFRVYTAQVNASRFHPKVNP